ncbi:MAG: glycogen synthase GlgA [Eubacterium sp.]|nr:glycogen synthase GlgA [Eubacterium sp.]
MKKVLFAASECVPFIKTGGLADVVGALPKYFDGERVEARVILPKYMCMEEKYKDMMTYYDNFYMDFYWRKLYVGILTCEYEGVTFYFIDNEEYFQGDRPYQNMPWDLGRFAFFCKAVLSALPSLDFKPDIIHCHDWQTAMIPVYLHERFTQDSYYDGIKTIMTIHNLQFQGIWNKSETQNVTGLSDLFFSDDKMGFYDDANMLKGGLVFADEITTVSKNYAGQIRTPFYGEKLEGVLESRADRLAGIINGIDYELYNPETDPFIAANYTKANFRRAKPKNKQDLQKRLGLAVDSKKFLIGIVSRLTDQKGICLIAYMMNELCADNVQLVVLGTGEEQYENMFRYFAEQYPDSVSANITYSDELAHKIYAGCDAFLMPSQFEPCGLSQMMAMRYGTLPIVRETGGLSDTVQPYNEYEGTGCGFSFTNFNAHEMLGTIRYAERVYFEHKRDWNKIVDRAMEKDFSWDSSAAEYMDLYERM